jgi:glutathione peroxidase-family protein
MFSKITVKAPAACIALTDPPRTPGTRARSMNFTKLLIGRDGKVLQRFELAVERIHAN